MLGSAARNLLCVSGAVRFKRGRGRPREAGSAVLPMHAGAVRKFCWLTTWHHDGFLGWVGSGTAISLGAKGGTLWASIGTLAFPGTERGTEPSVGAGRNPAGLQDHADAAPLLLHDFLDPG